MRKIDQLLDEYGESHQNKLNKAIHWICVPAIFFSIVGLLWSIPSGPLRLLVDSPWMNWATVALILTTLYYFRLSVSLAFGMLLFAMVCMLLAKFFQDAAFMALWKLCLLIFGVAWIGQFYGHKVEGKKPSFLKDIQFLLIGPAWLMHFIFNRLKLNY